MRFAWELLGRFQWAILLSIPPLIVLLYFLKLRREPLEVPSTYLWARTVEDLHVNSIWQKLRRNLLLFLQLLLLLFAILACLNPSWSGTKLEEDRSIFLIDNSASMSATDVGPSRLDEAKRQAAALIDEMKSGDVGMIIAFSDSDGARTIQSYTDNRKMLKQKLDTIQPTHRKTDLRKALRFAAGLANPGRNAYDEGDAAAADAMPAALFILSDGRIHGSPNFTLGNLKPEYIPIGKQEASNVGVVAFQATKNPEKPGQTQVFAGVKNYNAEPTQVELSLYLDDKLIDAESLAIEADAKSGAEFSLTDVESGVLRLEVDTKDDLDVDNRAWAVLGVTQRVRILLVTADNLFLESAVTTDRIKKYADVKITKPEYLTTEEYKKEAADGTYDLVIFDQCGPETTALMPLSNTVFFGQLPPGADAAQDDAEASVADETSVENTSNFWTTNGPCAGPAVIDMDQSHPLMQFVNMSNVLIGEAITLNPPKGATVLLDTDLGPMMAISTRDSVQDLVIGFGLIGRTDDGGEYFNTTWVRNDPSYPVFIQNLLSYLGGVSDESSQTIQQPGQLIQLRLDSASKQLNMKAPDGHRMDIGRGRSGAFAFTAKNNTGIYELTDPLKPDTTHRVAVNLFDEIESNLPPVMELELDEGVKVAGARGVARTRRETWKWLVLLVLFVLLTEWYIYNRRVYL